MAVQMRKYAEVGWEVYRRTGEIVKARAIKKYYTRLKDALRVRIRDNILRRKMTPAQNEKQLWEWEMYGYIRFQRAKLVDWENTLKQQLLNNPNGDIAVFDVDDSDEEGDEMDQEDEMDMDQDQMDYQMAVDEYQEDPRAYNNDANVKQNNITRQPTVSIKQEPAMGEAVPPFYRYQLDHEAYRNAAVVQQDNITFQRPAVSIKQEPAMIQPVSKQVVRRQREPVANNNDNIIRQNNNALQAPAVFIKPELVMVEPETKPVVRYQQDLEAYRNSTVVKQNNITIQPSPVSIKQEPAMIQPEVVYLEEDQKFNTGRLLPQSRDSSRSRFQYQLTAPRHQPPPPHQYQYNPPQFHPMVQMPPAVDPADEFGVLSPESTSRMTPELHQKLRDFKVDLDQMCVQAIRYANSHPDKAEELRKKLFALVLGTDNDEENVEGPSGTATRPTTSSE